MCGARLEEAVLARSHAAGESPAGAPDAGLLAAVTSLAVDTSARGIAAAIGELVRSGRVRPGDRLPTVRALAGALGVSPATVSDAWRVLAAVGLIESRGRAGTYVRTPEPERGPRRYLGLGGAPETIGLDLSTGTPDPALLPDLGPALDRVGRAQVALTGSYLGDPVLPDLATALLADWPFPAERLTVVDGALDALSRIVDHLVPLGAPVIVEDPGFPPLLDLLDRVGARLLPVPLDGEGADPAALRRAAARDPVAVFLQPRAQNPTGASAPAARIRAWAQALSDCRAVIVEDDHAGAIASAPDLSIGARLPQRTVRIRGYSKSHGPDLRIAAVGGPADLVDPLVARRMLGPGWTSRILQAVLADLLADPVAVAAVHRAQRRYAERREHLARALAAHGVRVDPGDGINMWVPVEDERSALITLAALGIRVAPGTPFRVGAHGGDRVRVTLGPIEAHVPRIAAALAAAAAPSRPAAGR